MSLANQLLAPAPTDAPTATNEQDVEIAPAPGKYPFYPAPSTSQVVL